MNMTLYFQLSSQEHIDDTYENLRSEGLELNVEDDLARLLVV